MCYMLSSFTPYSTSLYKSLYFSFSVSYIFSLFLRFSLLFLIFSSYFLSLFSLSFTIVFPLSLFSYILLSLFFTHSFRLILNKALGLASLSAYKLNKSFVCCVKMGKMALSVTRGNSAGYCVS